MFFNKLKKSYIFYKNMINTETYLTARAINKKESQSIYKRYDVINTILSSIKDNTCYLEIGVRNPQDNFYKINSTTKYSVDPGVEYLENPVDFKMESDVFFEELKSGKILNPDIKFDIIFIDGLHLADQVDKDIKNSLAFLKDNGYIVLHDCNPPSEWHAREASDYAYTPARKSWNGTTWKAFLKWRKSTCIRSLCVDIDYGVGVLSKNDFLPDGSKNIDNEFYEFNKLNINKKIYLNLISYSEFKSIFE